MKKYLILCFLIIGCTSRKVEINKLDTKEKIKTDSTAKIIEKVKEVIIQQNNINKTEFTYEPIDTKAEFVIDGKTYKNVRISHKKEVDNTNVISNKITAKNTDIAVKKVVNKQHDSLLKISDKKGIDLIAKIGIILVSILTLIGFGYLYINK